MSRSNLAGAKGPNNLGRTTLNDASGLFQTLQGHVDDLRALLQCGICIRPLYEPFTLACGHTFCYGCLTSWFDEGRSNNKSCPDCRAPVKSQPAPAYLVRAVVQMFTSRAELLEKGETTEQHKIHQHEEASRLESDKKNENPREGGLFRGVFNKTRAPIPQPLYDLEDNVMRCPHCQWELEEDSGCTQCGYRQDIYSISDTDWTGSETSSEMTDDFDEDIEDGFAEPDAFDWHEWYQGVPVDALPIELRQQLHGLARNPHVLRPPNLGVNLAANLGVNFGAQHHRHPEIGLRGTEADEEEEEEDDDDDDDDDDSDEDEERDTDMDDFIDDNENPDQYGSDSDQSTVVGAHGYSREQLHAFYEDQPVDHFPLRDGGVMGTISDEEAEEEDEDEEPVRPAINGNRRRIPTYQILSSSPAHVNAEATRNPTSFNTGSQPTRLRGVARSRHVQQAGSSALNVINIDSGSDSDEGPVGPVRRARGNCWPAAR